MGLATRRLVVSAVAVLVSGFFSMSVASGPIDYSQCRVFDSLTISVGQNVTLPKPLSSDLFKLERLWPLEGLICELVNGNMKQNYLKCVYGNSSIILINMQISDSGVYLVKNGFGPGICLNISVTGDSFRTTSSTPQAISKKPPSTHSPRSRIYIVIPLSVSLCVIAAVILHLYCSRKQREDSNGNKKDVLYACTKCFKPWQQRVLTARVCVYHAVTGTTFLI